MKGKWISTTEAINKWCPFALNGKMARKCFGDSCMAWRKMPVGNDKFSSPEVREANDKMGNCKLIDKD